MAQCLVAGLLVLVHAPSLVDRFPIAKQRHGLLVERVQSNHKFVELNAEFLRHWSKHTQRKSGTQTPAYGTVLTSKPSKANVFWLTLRATI